MPKQLGRRFLLPEGKHIKDTHVSSLLVSERVGNLRVFQANTDSPIFGELVSLTHKTLGLVPALSEALAPLAPRLQAAWVFGSVAAQTDTARSDVDVMLVGNDLTLGEVLGPLAPLEQQWGCKIKHMWMAVKCSDLCRGCPLRQGIQRSGDLCVMGWVLTGRSIRTWQRRIEEGLVPRLSDARERALVPFDAVRPALAVALDDEDVQTLVRADQGNAAAQAEMGALFALAALDSHASDPLGGGGSSIPALHFLTRAAEQGEADAMHWLGMLHAAGLGEEGDDCTALALMWIAKAAAHGHVIAQQQLAALIPKRAAF